MDILGKVSEGVVVLRDPKALPDGTVVRVEPVEDSWLAEAKEQLKAAEQAAVEADERGEPTVLQKLLKYAGTVKGWPSDMAENHDHYLHGTPKRTK